VGAALAHGGSPFQGRFSASEVNDGACPEKTVHLRKGYWIRLLIGPDPAAAA